MIAIIIVSLSLAGVFKMLHDLSEEGKIPFGNWWNKGSWHNKYTTESLFNFYENGNDKTYLKPKYFGSTTFLAFTTDGFHLFSFLHTACYQLVITLMLTFVTDLIWWHYIIIFVGLKITIGALGEAVRKVLYG